jgi:hypothetical protein
MWVVRNLILVHLEIVLVSVQGWSTVCTEHTIGIEIILDDLDSATLDACVEHTVGSEIVLEAPD